MRSFLKFLSGGVAITLMLVLIIMTQCVNNPWPESLQNGNIYFTSLSGDIKTVDPATSFYSHEADVMDLAYESLLTYHFLKRPYELIPLLAEEIPQPIYFDKQGNVLSGDPEAEKIGKVEYLVKLRKGVIYQPHPCFAKNKDGSYLYRNLSKADVQNFETPNDFPMKATREVTSHDFAVQLRRICDINTTSPIFSTFKSFIKGMDECSDAIRAETKRVEKEMQQKFNRNINEHPVAVNYENIPFAGVEIIDDHTFKIICTRKYPMILYWMAKSFMTPVPQEAIDFYAEPALIDKQIILKNWPVVTGAYLFKEFDPQRRVILERNPNHRHTFFPSLDEIPQMFVERGFDKDAGKPLPFIDTIVFARERENIPLWIKFIQGYYDNSGIAADMFDQAIATTPGGDMGLSDEMIEQGIELTQSVESGYFYLAFNMVDPIVGGYEPKKQKLRQAISMAIDWNEFIEIFMNGRGFAAQGPIPPEIHGHISGEAGTNPYTDVWNEALGKHCRQPIENAKKLMEEAGYPQGRDKDGKPLVIYFDHADMDKAIIAWLRKQFLKIGIDLRERVVDLNGFRDRIETGNWQTHLSGWLADYPDPENFLFLFYGPNKKVDSVPEIKDAGSPASGGSNSVNYDNAEYNHLFTQLESMNNGPQREALLKQVTEILRKDNPVSWGYFRTNFVLTHRWIQNYFPHDVAKNSLKYRRIDWKERQKAIEEWNRPNLHVVYTFIAIAWLLAIAGFIFVSTKRSAN